MDSRDIKFKAKEFSETSRMLLFKTMVILSLVSFVITEITKFSSILSFVAGIVLMTLNFGTVVCVLKIVNNREGEFEFPNDVFAGFTRFKEVIGTYFVYNVIEGAVVCVIIFVVMLFALGSIDVQEMSQIYAAGTNLDANSIDILASIGGAVLLAAIIMLVFVVFYSLNFALTYYILEKEGIRGIAAMKKSMQMMKGYKMLYTKITLAYLGKMILVCIPFSLVATLIPFLAVIINALMGIALIYFVTIDLTLCSAIIYEEASLSYNEADVEGAV